MTRKICVVTGSRAEYGLLYSLLRQIEEATDLELQLVVTGMHLSHEFGHTVEEIDKDGFTIAREVEMLLSSDSSVGITKATGLGMVGFADAFKELDPDIVVLLGDRFELLAAASAALFAVIPLAHIHGGELTAGAFDDAVRHSITKMAHLHFTATETYRRRVIQLGEDARCVFNVGAPGVENIRNLTLLGKSELEATLNFELGTESLLVTFHPVTLEPGMAEHSLAALLCALDRFADIRVIFTRANADTEGRKINKMIEEYVLNHSTAVVFTSMGHLRYLSTVKHVSGIVGNSSSGIIEAPSLKTGTINIGDRQKGRVRAESVIDCSPDIEDIDAAIQMLFSENFQRKLEECTNPYGDGDVSSKILEILRKTSLKDLMKKQFHDLEVSGSRL